MKFKIFSYFTERATDERMDLSNKHNNVQSLTLDSKYSKMLLYFQDSSIQSIVELEKEISKIFANILKSNDLSYFIESLEIFKDGFYVLPCMPTSSLLVDGDELEVKINIGCNQTKPIINRDRSNNRYLTISKIEKIENEKVYGHHTESKQEEAKASTKINNDIPEICYLKTLVQNPEADLRNSKDMMKTKINQSVQIDSTKNTKMNCVFKKRDLKERQKELEDLKQQVEKIKSSSDRSSSSSSSSSSESSSSNSKTQSKSKDIKILQNNIKITQPNPKINVLNPIDSFKNKKQIWEAKKNQKKGNKINGNQELTAHSSAPYLNQFDVIPKQKMSNKQKESIIDNHLKQLQPSKKDLIKGTKITPDSYGTQTNRPKSQPKARDIFIRDKRRDSHGNRAFSQKHKIENELKQKEASEYMQQGYLQLTNSNNEQILFDINNSLTKTIASELKVGDEIIIRAVIFDQAKCQPLDTDYLGYLFII